MATAVCNEICNSCGFVRSASQSHVYDNDSDAECNICEKVRYYSFTISEDNAIITCCDNSINGNITIPSTLSGYPVTSIYDFAFANCSYLTNVVIPESVTNIGESVFYACESLTNIQVVPNNNYYSSQDGVLFNKDKTILISFPGGKSGEYLVPNTVTTIGQSAFYSCNSLTGVTIGDSVTAIGDFAFYFCSSIESVIIGNSVTTLGFAAFSGCSSLTELTIGENITIINDEAFSYCSSLSSVTIPKSVTSIGNCAFYDCDSLVNLNISNSVISIGDCAFSSCELLENVLIPDSVITIGDSAFLSCNSLTNLTLGEGVTTICDYAFSWCESIASVTIPNSVMTVGIRAFYGCDLLADVYYQGSKQDAQNISIASDNDNLTNAVWHYILKNDLNGDGYIDENDFQYIVNVYTGKVKVDNKAEICDMNGDGRFDIRDIIAIREIINA